MAMPFDTTYGIATWHKDPIHLGRKNFVAWIGSEEERERESCWDSTAVAYYNNASPSQSHPSITVKKTRGFAPESFNYSLHMAPMASIICLPNMNTHTHTHYYGS